MASICSSPNITSTLKTSCQAPCSLHSGCQDVPQLLVVSSPSTANTRTQNPQSPWVSPSLTFGHDALHADNAAKETGCQRPRRHVLGAEAALQPDVEVLELLGISGINRGDKIL